MKITKSIRWRLQIWLAFLLASILTGFGVTAYQLHRVTRLNQIDEELSRLVATLGVDIRGRPPFGKPRGRPPFDSDGGRGFPEGRRGSPDGDFGPPPKRWMFEPGDGGMPRKGHGPDSMGPHGPPDSRMESRVITLSAHSQSFFDESDPNGFYFTIWSRGGNLLKRSTNAPAELARPDLVGRETTIQARSSDGRREAFQFTEIGESILVGRSIVADLNLLRRYAWGLAVAGTAVLGLGLGGGWLLVSGAIRPVHDISAAASRISAGSLSERINVAETDSELGRLAGVLNSTFARLEAAFAQQRQFTADASHELRTPLAVIISEAQTTLAHERTAPEYRETVGVCLDAAQQMKRLTQSLLQLARYDAGQESLERAPFDLADQTQACIELIRPLAKHKKIRILSDFVSTPITGDADRFSQVITNLLTNAIHYNRDEGEIRMSTSSNEEFGILTVADNGVGIAPEDLPLVFERFYRGDKSRGRASGRYGLGLAISKAIVDAHGGSIEVSSEVGVGTTFIVRLPKQP